MYTAESVYGVQPQMPSMGIAAPTQQMATDDLKGGIRALVDPNNPLFWLAGLVLVTMGMAGAAGSVRLGRAKVSVAAGSA